MEERLPRSSTGRNLQPPMYDLYLGAVWSDTELRKLLIRMKNRSILLIGDVDCAYRGR